MPRLMTLLVALGVWWRGLEPVRFIEIEGKRFLWRDLVRLRREQLAAAAAPAQPALFELREGSPAGRHTHRCRPVS